jgi:hypothetical protein
MLKFIRSAAIAAAVLLVPAASFGIASDGSPQPAAAAAAVPVAPIVHKASPPPFGLDAHAHEHESGLAPGQTADDFRNWLRASPAHSAQLTEFRKYLAAEGVDSVVPLWQLVRTSSSWSECGAEPFEAPPADKWAHIVETLKFVRDEVVPAVGAVEALSGYRNDKLNSCSDGAPKSAHRQFFALDLTPVNKAVTRADMIRSVCVSHARDGRAYEAGLGFYTGRRFHVDSHGFRKWGPDGRGATSPCNAYA